MGLIAVDTENPANDDVSTRFLPVQWAIDSVRTAFHPEDSSQSSRISSPWLQERDRPHRTLGNTQLKLRTNWMRVNDNVSCMQAMCRIELTGSVPPRYSRDHRFGFLLGLFGCGVSGISAVSHWRITQLMTSCREVWLLNERLV